MIWDFKELELTPDQIASIKQVVNSLQQRLEQLRARLEARKQEYQVMLTRNDALEKLRAKLQEIAALQVDMQMADVESSRAINAVMTPQQLLKWHELQKAASTPH
jgi:Spy/CpxP family protein refolding chaperone